MQLTDKQNKTFEVDVNITGDVVNASEVGALYRQYKDKRPTKEITGINITHKKGAYKLVEFIFNDGSIEQALVI